MLTCTCTCACTGTCTGTVISPFFLIVTWEAVHATEARGTLFSAVRSQLCAVLIHSVCMTAVVYNNIWLMK